MPSALDNLLNTFNLERIERNIYRGVSPKVGWQRVFGGHVICQALLAAQETVDKERHVHSLHGYFMRPGDPENPIIYNVDRIRDGGSFTTRRVVAIQHGEAIFSMSLSFQKLEEGLEHQIEMPDVPLPDQLPSETDLLKKMGDTLPDNVRTYLERERPIELRAVDMTHYFSNKKLDPVQNIWMRTNGSAPKDYLIQNALLAYASDMTLLDTSLFAHGKAVADPSLQVASLDHSMWFHQPFDMSEWHLYSQDSPRSSGGRGLSRGSIYNLKGELVASCAQEGLIRPRKSGKRVVKTSHG